MKFSAWVLLLCLSVGGCAAPNTSSFAGAQPSMAPNDWMVGTVNGYGIVRDRFGHVKSQFHVQEIGSWNPATRTVTLAEHIVYLHDPASKPSDRTWYFVESTEGRWTGTAGDVLGTASGEQQGNAWHLTYRQFVPVGGHQLAVTVDDWRLREADNVAVDNSAISKLGINLADVQIAFIKSTP